jgi:hypothetical protein
VRNAEGGFGYIYTANESEVSNAEQNVADKENELYNTSLDNYNNYQ